MRRAYMIASAGAVVATALGLGGIWLTAAANLKGPPPPPRGDSTTTGICVRGFSKDACNGRVDFNDSTIVTYTGCNATPSLPGCRTVSVRSASLFSGIRPSIGSCSNAVDVACDEFCDIGSMSGRFEFDLDITNDGCPYRGCWRAKDLTFSGTSLPVVVISGSAMGTLGTGSHRVGCQISPTHQRCDLDDCENCRDVEFIPDPDDPTRGTWRIGLEGMITGRVESCPQRGGEVCVMIQGDLFIAGTSSGIGNLWDGFDFCGTLDGVTVTTCTTP